MTKSRLLGILFVYIVLLYSSVLNASTWTEILDAGALPATAQQITGNGVLNTINGVIYHPNSVDVDMFAIYLPAAMAQFTARASIPPQPDGDPNFGGPQLFLFDSNGIGVYASQETENAFISFNPQNPGLYYLAASPWDIDPFGPKDQFGRSDPIWLDGTGSSTPNGPAASLPVSGWGGSYDGTSSAYTITLTGAEFITTVPIPSALWLFGSGLLGLVGLARRRSSK